MIQVQVNTAVMNCKCGLLQEDFFNIFDLPSEVVEVRILHVGSILRHGQVLPRAKVSGNFGNFKSFENAALMAVKNSGSSLISH